MSEWEFCVVQLDTFYHQQDYEKLFIQKNCVSIPLAGLSETRKSQLIYNWLQIGTFQPKVDKTYLFRQHLQSLYDIMQKVIENLEFAQKLDFEFIDWLKNNGTKYSLFFDNFCGGICNSKAFVDIATAGRHHGLSTIHIRHNLFHQGKPGWDIELQNTHLVLFKSPVM